MRPELSLTPIEEDAGADMTFEYCHPSETAAMAASAQGTGRGDVPGGWRLRD